MDTDFSSEHRADPSMRSLSSGHSSMMASSTLTGSFVNNKHTSPSTPVLEMVKEETRVVIIAKIFLVLGIVVAATSVGTATFLLLRREESRNFHDEVRVERRYYSLQFLLNLCLTSPLPSNAISTTGLFSTMPCTTSFGG